MDVFLPLDFTQSLTACQVHQVESGIKSVVVSHLFFDVDSEDCVRTRAMLVDVSLLVDSILFTVIHKCHCLIKVLDALF